MRSTIAAVSALGALSLALPAAAQPLDDGDAPAPSLELPTDPELPHWSLAVSADPLGMFFGELGLRVEGTLGRAHSLWVEPAYLLLPGVDAVGVEAGYHLWPFGLGLSGLYLGPVLGAAVTTGRTVTCTASLEVGYQYVWQGIVLGGGAGVTWARTFDRQDTTAILPRIQLAIGYAWM